MHPRRFDWKSLHTNDLRLFQVQASGCSGFGCVSAPRDARPSPAHPGDAQTSANTRLQHQDTFLARFLHYHLASFLSHVGSCSGVVPEHGTVGGIEQRSGSGKKIDDDSKKAGGGSFPADCSCAICGRGGRIERQHESGIGGVLLLLPGRVSLHLRLLQSRADRCR